MFKTEIEKYIGQKVRITQKDGFIFFGILKQVTDNSVEIKNKTLTSTIDINFIAKVTTDADGFPEEG